MDKKITQREWDRAVGIGSPPEEKTILPEIELDKSTGEPVKKYDYDIQIGWKEEDFED